MCEKCLTSSREATRRRRRKHPDAFRENYHRRKKEGHCTNCGVPKDIKDKTFSACKQCRKAERQRAVRTKSRVITLYGGACKCCGESKLAFLTIDHINNDGGQKRRESGMVGGRFYKHLLKSPVDPTLQVLCWNCNLGRRLSGVCPHQDNSYVEEALVRGTYERLT